MIRNVHSDMTLKSDFFSKTEAKEQRFSFTSFHIDMTRTCEISTYGVTSHAKRARFDPQPFPFLIPPWPQEVKSLAEQPLNISVTGSLEGHDRQADVWGRYSLSIFDFGLGRKAKEQMSNPRSLDHTTELCCIHVVFGCGHLDSRCLWTELD